MQELTDITVEKSGGVLRITFNRPDRLNAFSEDLLSGTAEALDRAAEDPDVRVIVLTGKGRAFCAGADTKRMAAAEGGPGSESMTPIQRIAQSVLTRLHQHPKPIIGALNGVAAGAGFEIALACDLRIASEDAFFKEAAMGVGLVAGDGSTWFLPRLVGLARAFEILLLEERVSAARALEIGLVNWVVPAADFEAEVNRIAGLLAAAPPVAVRLTKKSIVDGLHGSLDATLQDLLQYVEITRLTADHREGSQAVAERRPPVYRGE